MGIRKHQKLMKQTKSTNKTVPDKTNIEKRRSNNSPTDFQNFNNRALILHSPLITINLL